MRTIITESERSLILKLHGNQKQLDSLVKQSMGLINTISESVVITDWISPDDRYLILFDELYDLKTSTKLGDIWENFDNLKLFIKHSFEVATNVPKEIKESVFNTINSLVLTESTSNMTKLKPLLKQILKEEGFVDWLGSGLKKTGEWAVDSVKRFGSDAAELASKTWSGAKQVGSAIAKGDWSSIVDILSKGLLFFARKLRSLLYNPTGIVLDSILIATGIGKSVQWIPWAIIVALDIYEVSTGDYEEWVKDMPTWLRWIMIGGDVLGLVFAGGVASAARSAFSIFKGARTVEEFTQIAAKNPGMVTLIEKIVGAFSKVPELLQKAATYLKGTRLSKAASWIENILTKSESVLTNATNSLKSISNAAKEGGKIAREVKLANAPTIAQRTKAGLSAGAKTAGAVTAIDKGIKKGMQLYYGLSDQEVEDNEMIAKSLEDFEKETGQSYEDWINTELNA